MSEDGEIFAPDESEGLGDPVRDVLKVAESRGTGLITGTILEHIKNSKNKITGIVSSVVTSETLKQVGSKESDYTLADVLKYIDNLAIQAGNLPQETKQRLMFALTGASLGALSGACLAGGRGAKWGALIGGGAGFIGASVL